MISICLAKSLTADAQAWLLTYRKDYLIDNVACTPLMHKIIMCLATIISVARIQALCDNLHALGACTSTVSGNIDKINTEFDKNSHKLLPKVQLLVTQLACSFLPTKSSPASTSRTTSTECTRITSMESTPWCHMSPSWEWPSRRLITCVMKELGGPSPLTKQDHGHDCCHQQVKGTATAITPAHFGQR